MSSCVKNSEQPKAGQAQWNVQVVKGKVTTRCLWNACKALSIGLLLLTVGTTMAVIGYYADQLSIRSETRGNSTVKIRNESRGFHLNNLSYAGPIVMGVGGFIVVAACVMTFEARDSAAKVVPARFKANANASVTGETHKVTPRASRSFQRVESRRSASVQTPGGKSQEKMDTPAGGAEWSPQNEAFGRKAFTAAFVQFSRELIEKSAMESHRRWEEKMSEGKLKKSPSAPDLSGNKGRGPLRQKVGDNVGPNSGKGSPRDTNRLQRESVRPVDTVSSHLLLRPHCLQRQALSMDNPFYDTYDSSTSPSRRLSRQHSRRSGGSRDSFEMEMGSSACINGSQTSMALDLHECQVTLKVKDESANKRSETARRHQLLRQKPVEDEMVVRCYCVPKYCFAAMVERSSGRAKSSTSLRSPCHHCRRTPTRSHPPKLTLSFRSQSLSQTSVPTRPIFLEDPSAPKVFCIDDHRPTNHSSDNLKHSCPQRHSPGPSPRSHGPKCLLHGPKDPSGPRNNDTRRRGAKMEGSLSAEEPHTKRLGAQPRSGSFSPPGQGEREEGP